MLISMLFTETGFTNPIDEAIRSHRQFDLARLSEGGRNPL